MTMTDCPTCNADLRAADWHCPGNPDCRWLRCSCGRVVGPDEHTIQRTTLEAP